LRREAQNVVFQPSTIGLDLVSPKAALGGLEIQYHTVNTSWLELIMGS